jgi:hypothetical protein
MHGDPLLRHHNMINNASFILKSARRIRTQFVKRMNDLNETNRLEFDEGSSNLMFVSENPQDSPRTILAGIMVGLAGFEPATPRCLSYQLSVVCSNHAELQARRVVCVRLLF